MTVRLLDWTVKPDVKRDISTTEINLSARQAAHHELYQSQTNRDIFEIMSQFQTITDAPITEQLQHHIKCIRNIPVVGDGCLEQGLVQGLDPCIEQWQKPRKPKTLINGDTFTVMFSCPTIKSLHNLWKLAEDGDLSDIMKSSMFGYIRQHLPLESLNLESTIDADEYRQLQTKLQGHSGGDDTVTNMKSIQS